MRHFKELNIKTKHPRTWYWIVTTYDGNKVKNYDISLVNGFFHELNQPRDMRTLLGNTTDRKLFTKLLNKIIKKHAKAAQ